MAVIGRGEMVSLRDPVLAACQEAGTEILAVRARLLQDKEIGTREKADRSPVTQADLAAHRILIERLPQINPLPVVGEEGSTDRTPDGAYWLMDPLDGTKEFIAGRKEFTVNVALVGADGRVLLGVVVSPAAGESYAGVPGTGAWRHAGSWQPIAVGALAPGEACRIVVSRSHATGPLSEFAGALRGAGHAVTQIPVGSSLKLCRVATGEAHVYPRFGPTMHWDIAAAQAVVEGAGGSVMDLEGAPLAYSGGNRKNPWFIAGGRSWRPWTTFAPSGGP